jgi:hypothetical protein
VAVGATGSSAGAAGGVTQRGLDERVQGCAVCAVESAQLSRSIVAVMIVGHATIAPRL